MTPPQVLNATKKQLFKILKSPGCRFALFFHASTARFEMKTLTRPPRPFSISFISAGRHPSTSRPTKIPSSWLWTSSRNGELSVFSSSHLAFRRVFVSLNQQLPPFLQLMPHLLRLKRHRRRTSITPILPQPVTYEPRRREVRRRGASGVLDLGRCEFLLVIFLWPARR